MIFQISLSLSASDTCAYALQFKQRQFSLRPAFAMSINKAQGQSVTTVGIDLRRLVFSHGQLYVALSQARSPERIKILLPLDEKNGLVSNIVYDNILVD